ncbi:hypothetical protein QJQ45_001571 [Haematococcus lacustris]|nr:hypothetical protein QJQ45_001571 [Haematococcus lacustris]
MLRQAQVEYDRSASQTVVVAQCCASGSGQQEDEGQGQGEQDVIAERRQVIEAAFRGLVEATRLDLSKDEVDAVVAEVNKRMTMGSMQCCLAAVGGPCYSFLGQPTPGFPEEGPGPAPSPCPAPAWPSATTPGPPMGQVAGLGHQPLSQLPRIGESKTEAGHRAWDHEGSQTLGTGGGSWASALAGSPDAAAEQQQQPRHYGLVLLYKRMDLSCGLLRPKKTGSGPGC